MHIVYTDNLGDLMGGERVITISDGIEALIEKTRIVIRVKDKTFLLYEES